MNIPIGTKIGPYEIVGWLGAGGMGEVYRARDPRLGRHVAIKLIPQTFAADGGRLQRFEQEALAAGQINHPNIVAVYDVGLHGGAPYIVSELLEGESLRSRLHGGPLPARKATDYACQTAAGLAAAHDKGIVHRDLKPDNLFITNDGRIKILDFGIAKLTRPGEGIGGRHTGFPTETEAGMVVGTAGYMSPEQVRGETVDARSDIFSVGTTLYEMLVGRPAFTRGTGPDTMAAVLKEDPPEPLPPRVPPALARIVSRCLEKSRETRFQSARDLAFALEVLSDTGAAAAIVPVESAGAQWQFRSIPWLVAGALALALAGIGAWKLSRPVPSSLKVTRFTFIPPEAPPFAGVQHMVDLSPDGTQIVYVSTNRLYIRSMSELSARAAQGADGLQSLSEPVFSPDGRTIAFYARGDQTLKRIGVAGGAIATICSADAPTGISWSADGIVFAEGNKGIFRVSPEPGSTPQPIVRVSAGELADGPQILPGGSHVLFTLATGAARDRWDRGQIVVQSLKTGDRKTLVRGGSDARYLPTGHIVYAIGGVLYAVAFDVSQLEVKGEAVPILEGVSRSAGGATGAANFTVSNTGSLAYIPGPVSASLFELALIDRGAVESLSPSPGSYLFPRASPDGRRVAFGTDDGRVAVIHTRDLSRDGATQSLTLEGNNRYPVWTSPGDRIAFQSDLGGDLAIWQATVGAGRGERLTTPQPGESHEPESWSPITDTLLFSVRKGRDVSLWTYSFRSRTAAPFGDVRSTSGVLPNAMFSPDGRWVAYTSDVGGAITIYVQPFPATGQKHQVVAKGADDPHQPLWSIDGKELFYVPRPGAFESVAVSTRPFFFGNPRGLPWWDNKGARPFFLGPPTSRRSYDLMPDGRFLGVILGAGGQTGAGPAPHIEMVLNWFEEVKAITARDSAAR